MIIIDQHCESSTDAHMHMLCENAGQMALQRCLVEVNLHLLLAIWEDLPAPNSLTISGRLPA